MNYKSVTFDSPDLISSVANNNYVSDKMSSVAGGGFKMNYNKS